MVNICSIKWFGINDLFLMGENCFFFFRNVVRIVVYCFYNICSIEVDDCIYVDFIYEFCGVNKNFFKYKGYVVWDVGI